MSEEAKAADVADVPQGEAAAALQQQSKAAKPKKEKKVPEGLVITPKPKLTKADRRALQEQQRAAKAAGGKKSNEPPKAQANDGGSSFSPKTEGQTGGGNQPQPTSGPASAKKVAADGVGKVADKKDASAANIVATNTLVPTLPPFRNPKDIFDSGARLMPKSVSGAAAPNQLHPAVIALGYQYATGEIRGGNARCRSMLQCFEAVLQDFTPPPASADGSGEAVDYRIVLDQQILKASFHFWTETCRPHSVSMGNAFTALKAAVASLDRSLSFEAMKQVLLETIRAYSRERIEYAGRAIADLANQKLLRGGDNNSECDHPQEVILTFGFSEVVDLTLRLAAVTKKKNFRVIVTDSQPLLEGRRMLSHLRCAGIECTYVLLNALTYVLQDATKVLLGASALMSDGSIWGRAGTACVALAANAENIPVLVCSETYKISNRVQLESLTANELGSPYHPVPGATTANLRRLNLLYDLTPASFVDGIVTELGIIPPSSVAVLLREMSHPQG